jgi:hypothetical protein
MLGLGALIAAERAAEVAENVTDAIACRIVGT